MPELEFRIEGSAAITYAAVPTIALKLRIRSSTDQPVRSIMLGVQIRIAAGQRSYNPAEQARLVEVFGEPARWAETVNSHLWTNTTLLVPPFGGETLVDLAVPCTYDFDVVSAKYFDALEGGHVPIELLFSGTVFYASDAGLQAERISWNSEAPYQLPVIVWQEMMAHYFPNSAWVRLSKETFDRLYAYRTSRTLATWDAALDDLLRGAGALTGSRA